MLPETTYDRNEDQHVQQICSIAGFRERTHDAPVEPARKIQFADDQEVGNRHERDAESAKLPARFKIHREGIRARDGIALRIGNAEVEEAPHDRHADNPQRQRKRERSAPAEAWNELPEIEAKEHIAEEPAYIVERPESIPRRFTPEEGRRTELWRAELGKPKAADERKERGGQPKQQPAAHLAFRRLFRPWRQERHEKIQPHEHVHEPEMSARERKVERELAPFPPCGGVDAQPHGIRDEHTYKASPEEFAGWTRHRKEQIA